MKLNAQQLGYIQELLQYVIDDNLTSALELEYNVKPILTAKDDNIILSFESLDNLVESEGGVSSSAGPVGVTQSSDVSGGRIDIFGSKPKTFNK